MLLTKALQIDTNNLNRCMTVGGGRDNVKDTRDDIELRYEQTEDREDRGESPREEDQRNKADTNTARMVVVSTVVKAPPSPPVEKNKAKQNSFKILKKNIKKSLVKRVSKGKKKNKADKVVSVNDNTRDELVNNNRFKPVDDARDVDDTLDEEEDRSSTPTVIDFGDWFTTPKPPTENEKTLAPLEEKKESVLVTVEEDDDESSEGSITSEINSVANIEEKKMERTPSISSRQSSRSGRSTPVAFILESWGDESVNDCLDNRQLEPPVVEVGGSDTKNMESFPDQVLGQGLDLKRFQSSPLATLGRQRSNPISTFKSMSMGKQEREELMKLIKFNAQLEKKKAELERQKIELDKEMLARYGSDDTTKLSGDSSDYSASLASSNEYGSYSSKETRESFDGESWASFFHGEQSAVSDGNTSFVNKIFGSFLCSCGEKEKETYNDRLAMM